MIKCTFEKLVLFFFQMQTTPVSDTLAGSSVPTAPPLPKPYQHKTPSTGTRNPKKDYIASADIAAASMASSALSSSSQVRFSFWSFMFGELDHELTERFLYVARPHLNSELLRIFLWLISIPGLGFGFRLGHRFLYCAGYGKGIRI